MTMREGAAITTLLAALAIAFPAHAVMPVHAAPPAHAALLQRIADVPLPGSATRFDYQSLDTTANRLYIAHLGAGELVVFDVAARKVLGTVTDLPGVTGICVVRALGKMYVSVPGYHHVAIIDLHTLSVVARTGNVGFPDGIAYAANVKKLYVSDESAGDECVIDGLRDRAMTTIAVGGQAGNSVYDPHTGNVLVAVQTANKVVEIDPRTDSVVNRHAIAGSDHPHGMAIDAAHRLLFVASENNAALHTIDLRNWHVVDQLKVGDKPDVLAFDPGWQRLYVGCESGSVSVFTVRGGHLAAEGQITLPHAHTVAVDPRTHHVYVPLQKVGTKPVLRIMSARRP